MYGIFAFGAVMVGALWAYWELYTRPFRPLQYAIAKRFPESSPRVVGGRHKSHKPGSPNILRIIVQVPVEEFDPTSETQKAEHRAAELVRIARRLQVLDRYDQLEVHLIQRIPERAEKHWQASHSVDDWKALVGGSVPSLPAEKARAPSSGNTPQ